MFTEMRLTVDNINESYIAGNIGENSVSDQKRCFLIESKAKSFITWAKDENEKIEWQV